MTNKPPTDQDQDDSTDRALAIWDEMKATNFANLSDDMIAAAFARHREADPHCTCNDCIDWASRESEGDEPAQPPGLNAAGVDNEWVLAANKAWAALQVLVLDSQTRAYLKQHDPKALQQASRALFDAGQQYLPGQGVEPSDLCWFCFNVLLPSGVCRDCAEVRR